MGCGKFRSGPPRTHRELQIVAGFTVYSCLETEKRFHKPACVAAKRCLCTDEIIEPPGEGFICGPDIVTCALCLYVADFLCDWPLGKGKTCDAPLCEEHALPVGANLDALRPDDLAMRRDPAAQMIYDRRLAILSDLHYCPAHFAESQRKEHRK